jgi:hypothetical protein
MILKNFNDRIFSGLRILYAFFFNLLHLNFHLEIPARTWMIIYAYTSNKNIDAGWVPLQDIGPKLFFGYFIAINLDGKVYGECINISDEPVSITAQSFNFYSVKRL